MGCKCKEKAKAAEKYADEKIIVQADGFDKVFAYVKHFIVVIFTFIIIIIVLPVIILAYFFNMVTGNKTVINISKLLTKNGNSK